MIRGIARFPVVRTALSYLMIALLIATSAAAVQHDQVGADRAVMVSDPAPHDAAIGFAGHAAMAAAQSCASHTGCPPFAGCGSQQYFGDRISARWICTASDWAVGTDFAPDHPPPIRSH